MSGGNKQRRGGLGRGLGSLIPTAPAGPGGRGSDGGSTEPGAPTASDRPVPERAATPAAAVAPGAAGSVDLPVPADPAAAPGPDAAVGDAGGPLPVPGASFLEIPVTQIHANAQQPRQVFDEDALAELTHSIREFGVLQPVVVRADEEGYELVMGERRLRAATAAGLTAIPAIVRTTADDAMLRDALLENIHRAQLNPLEEAAAYQQLLEEFGATHEELAGRIGRSRPQVTNTIRLLNLSLAVQRRVAAGILSAGHARALLTIDDAETQDELAARIVAEGLSVRATEELAALARTGSTAKPSRRAAGPKITAPAATELAHKLSDVFDTRVRVDIGRRKGRITVEFASIDDLERIVGVMAPQLERRQPRNEP
ncbi:chromosome partitioning protein, ParB family [Jatrophihabitans endophyticus]|uniref:Chromosome partitioning protein, ParB family n=1 Tax=Jatrophihabitans endophyticus TaxID=1206085 RepID=A0A1M5HVE7_9ACTN|nr:ParB/RepB/Spo0J family partition protein [Jatrophihabitans endophyticus]SHG19887.1 chromosome partitioning protein, ParB family [Jatrophihabitans endophyticus]